MAEFDDYANTGTDKHIWQGSKDGPLPANIMCSSSDEEDTGENGHEDVEAPSKSTTGITSPFQRYQFSDGELSNYLLRENSSVATDHDYATTSKKQRLGDVLFEPNIIGSGSYEEDKDERMHGSDGRMDSSPAKSGTSAPLFQATHQSSDEEVSSFPQLDTSSVERTETTGKPTETSADFSSSQSICSSEASLSSGTAGANHGDRWVFSMLREIPCHPCLWDDKHKERKSTNAMNEAWSRIEEDIRDKLPQGKTVADMKYKWKIIRDDHFKKEKALSGCANRETKASKYSNWLTFLNKRHTKSGSRKRSATDASMTSFESDDMNTETYEEREGQLVQEQLATESRRQKLLEKCEELDMQVESATDGRKKDNLRSQRSKKRKEIKFATLEKEKIGWEMEYIKAKDEKEKLMRGGFTSPATTPPSDSSHMLTEAEHAPTLRPAVTSDNDVRQPNIYGVGMTEHWTLDGERMMRQAELNELDEKIQCSNSAVDSAVELDFYRHQRELVQTKLKLVLTNIVVAEKDKLIEDQKLEIHRLTRALRLSRSNSNAIGMESADSERVRFHGSVSLSEAFIRCFAPFCQLFLSFDYILFYWGFYFVDYIRSFVRRRAPPPRERRIVSQTLIQFMAFRKFCHSMAICYDASGVFGCLVWLTFEGYCSNLFIQMLKRSGGRTLQQELNEPDSSDMQLNSYRHRRKLVQTKLELVLAKTDATAKEVRLVHLQWETNRLKEALRQSRNNRMAQQSFGEDFVAFMHNKGRKAASASFIHFVAPYCQLYRSFFHTLFYWGFYFVDYIRSYPRAPPPPERRIVSLTLIQFMGFCKLCHSMYFCYQVYGFFGPLIWFVFEGYCINAFMPLLERSN